MIVWICAAIGVLVGAYAAKRRGGNRLDMAQYAFAYGVTFLVVSWILSLLIFRLL